MDSAPVDEGADAYCAGVPRHHCPHELGTSEHVDWLRGWDEAEQRDLEELADSMTGG